MLNPSEWPMLLACCAIMTEDLDLKRYTTNKKLNDIYIYKCKKTDSCLKFKKD